jgi:transposase InsO family protein
MLGVAPSGFFYWRTRPPSERKLRSEHLGGLISDIHHASNGTYGTRRVTAELRFGYELTVNRKTVRRIMRRLTTNAMMESFWGRMQTELLNRKRWRTRLELVVCQATFAVLMRRFSLGLSVLRLRQWMYRRMRRAWVAWSGWSVPASVKYLSARNCASILFSQEA